VAERPTRDGARPAGRAVQDRDRRRQARSAIKPHLASFQIDRPTYEVALYRPGDVLAGSVKPTRTSTVHLAPAARRVVRPGIVPRRSDYSLLDLETGRTSDLADPFMQMAANGHSLIDECGP
jgi:hypothetical protein